MKPSSGLYILENAEMPTVLLEMGFISNADDAAVLSDHPELFARGIYSGIIDYFESIYTLDLSILLWIMGASTILIIFFMAVLLKMKKQLLHCTALEKNMKDAGVLGAYFFSIFTS